ncbi:hypothetical protein YC2023_066220 [Brassica napus]
MWAVCSVHTGNLWVSVSTHRTSVAVHVCLCVSVWVRQHTQDVWLSISTHISTLVLGLSTPALPMDCLGDFGPRGLSVQYTQDVCGCPSAHTGRPWLSVCFRVCPSAHTGRPWLSISTHISTLVLGLSTLALPVDCLGDFGARGLSVQYTQDVCGMLTLPVDCSGDFGPRGLSIQYTQDVCGCPPAHTGRPQPKWAKITRTVHGKGQHAESKDQRVLTDTHTRRLWLSISTHISTLVHGFSMLALPVDCLGDYGPRGLSGQYTQDVRGSPPANTGRLWLSVAVRQHTQDVRGCPCVSVYVCQHTQNVCGCPSVHISARGSLDSYTHEVYGCPSAHTGRPWLSMCVCVCPSASVSTHRMSGCPSVHISARCTHRTCVGVRQHTQDIRGCPCVSVCVRQHTQDVRGCPSVHISARCTHRTSVGVRQHTQDVRVCPSAHTGRPWLSISTHISTLVLGLSMLTLPVDCSGDFGPRGLSVQYTPDVCGCPPAHTRRLWLSVCVRVFPSVSVSTHKMSVAVHHTHRTSAGLRQHTQDVCGCPWLSVAVRQHTQDVCGCPCVSVSTHRTSVAVLQYKYQHAGPWTQHAGPSRGLFGSFWPMWAVCSVHTGSLWVSVSTHRTSVAVHVCPCVSVSTHRTSGCPSLHISARWSLDTALWPFPWTVWVILAQVGCLFNTHRTSVGVRQHTQDVHGCPWLSVSTHRTSVAVRVCSCVSVNTHRKSVAVHQYTYQHAGPWTQHAGPFCGLLGTSVECSGDFGPRGLSVQYTQDVCGCPSAHTGRPWLSVCVRQHTQDVCGCPSEHISARWSLDSARWPYPWTVWVILAHVGCLFITNRTSVGVRQHTQDVRVCPSCVCPSEHTGRLWLSITTHISTLVLGLSMLTLPVDCSGDFGPRGLSVQYTQDVRGCPPAHTGGLWLSVFVRVCPSVSVSTHKTYVAVHQYTYQHVGPWIQHAGPSRGLFGWFWPTWAVWSVHTGRPWDSASTHRTSVAVRGCPSAHTGRPGLSVCVRVCLSAHTERLWLSYSTHIRTRVLGLSMLALLVDCSGDFGPCKLSVQYTQEVCGCPWLCMCVRVCPSVSVSTHRTFGCPSVHISARCPWTQHSGPSVDCLGDFGPRGLSVQSTLDVRGCPLAHTECPWLSSSTHRTSVPVCVCSCVSVSTQRTSVAVHQYTYQHAGPRTQHAGPSCVLLGTSVAVHQYTYQHVGPWTQHADPSRGLFGTSVAVCVCLSAHTERPWLSISTHISTLVLGLSTLALPVECLGDFSPRGLSVQYTQDVCGCPLAHKGRPCVSVSTHRTSVAVHQYTYQHYTQDVRGCPPAHTGRLWLSVSVRVCPSVSVSTHRTSVAVHQYTYQHYTQEVRGCPPAHTGRLWLSVGVRQDTQDVCGCPCVWAVCSVQTSHPLVSVSTHMTSVAVRLCPSAHKGRPCVSVSTHRTSVAVHQYTYQHVVHTGRSCPVDCLGDFGPRGLSVQYTQDVRGCLSAHTGRPWLSHVGPWTQYADPSRGLFGTSVAVRVCPCVSGSTCRTSVAVHHTHRKSVGVRQHTPDICGCLWLSVSTHRTSVAVCVCPCVAVSTHRTSVAVHQYTYQHAGPRTQHAGPSCGLLHYKKTAVF